MLEARALGLSGRHACHGGARAGALQSSASDPSEGSMVAWGDLGSSQGTTTMRRFSGFQPQGHQKKTVMNRVHTNHDALSCWEVLRKWPSETNEEINGEKTANHIESQS